MRMRSVVVTGGGTGIGRAIAAAFVAAGDEVVITGRRTEVLHETAERIGARPVVCDATDVEQVTRLAEAAGDVDVLVNCAGGNTDFDRAEPGDLHELAAAWRANLDANLLSAVLVTAALRPRLRSGGAVVHIGSIAADKGAGAYGAAKAGLASWNVQLSAELGAEGITSNVLAPGYVADTEFFRDRLTPQRRDFLVESARTKRASVPDDIAATVVFLASGGARQITGQVLNVNGGERTTR
jgi:3-oxoacyl-[acyl-carrier protein] reductase